LCLLTEDNNNTIIMRPHIVFTDRRQQRHKVVLWLGCHCCPSVNTICGRIMTGLSSISKHNMWSYYDWVVVVVHNPIIMRPNIVFTDEQQQRQPNHNTTHIRFTDGRQRQPNHALWLGCRLPSVNTICGCIMIGLSLLSLWNKTSFD
jgi:hypothetical protein